MRTGTGWAAGNETPSVGRDGQNGPVTYIRINAAENQNIVLTTR
jgi:hypothetical protein